MAKRSDFAQKLLDDLRLRKERLAAAQSSGATPTSKARGSYAYSKQTFRGSTGHGKAAITVDNTHFRSGGANRSSPMEETMTQLVPFGRGQGSHQIGDLSMALALALENGGKLRQFDSSGRSSVLTFLPKMGRAGLQSQGNHGRNPSLSHLHIQEISKGAQKLNQILRACSNGLNFDKYSIEIGKELLKGATDLQQALQMLVNLQEASESMVQPRSTSRIVLLEDDKEVKEEEPVKEIEKKQLDLIPRFSFDKPTRQGRPQKQQRLPALVHPSESASNSISAPKRSMSYGTDQEKQNVSSSSNGKVGKGRMSNVIAKLMGLEEVPRNMDSDRSRTKIAELKTKHSAGPVVSSTKHDTTKPVKINPGTLGEIEESRASHGRRNAAAKFQEKPPWKKPESVKATMAMDQTSIRQSNRREEQCRTGETETRIPLHEKLEQKENKAQTEKKDKKRTGNELPFTRSMETPKEKQPESEKRTARQRKGNEVISRPQAQRERPTTEQPKLKKYLPDEAVYLKKSREFPEGRQGQRGGKIMERDKIKITRISSMKKAQGTAFQEVAKVLTRRSSAREAKQLNNGEACMVRQTKVDTTEELLNNAVKELEGEGKVDSHSNNLNLDPGRSVLLPSNTNNGQRNTAGFDADRELESAKFVEGTTTSTVPQLDKENIPVPEIHEPFTEPETRLKHVLLQSRLFLNAAEALFKISTPIGISKANGQDYSFEDEDDKLALDCAFEILRRKGRRRELAVYPFARKARIGFPNISSFDDVVRQLYKSFDGLRAHGRKECHNSEVEDYLPRMLELDVCMRNPETDCMWDSGWEVPTFAMLEKDEVVKDVERLITSSLIDEMARDVLHMYGIRENIL